MNNAQPPPEEWLTLKGRLTRARIIDTAADLFARYGVAGTSLEDVRREAGVSGSQITHYFGGKPGLIRAVIGQNADAALEGPGPARLETLVDLLTQAGSDAASRQGPDWRLGMLAAELTRSDPQTQAELARGFATRATQLQKSIEELQRRGILRQDADPQALAHGLLAALYGGMLITRTTQSSTPLTAAIGAMLAHIASFRTDQPPHTPTPSDKPPHTH
ncbi:MAG TPA: TetR/AcrR family transcriptional regulator [Streptosporangiaceae bacterium]